MLEDGDGGKTYTKMIPFRETAPEGVPRSQCPLPCCAPFWLCFLHLPCSLQRDIHLQERCLLVRLHAMASADSRAALGRRLVLRPSAAGAKTGPAAADSGEHRVPL